MVPAQRTRLKILTALIAGSVAMGCGSDGGDKPGGGDMTGDGVNPNDEGNLALELTFSPMYSAFGGSHEFRLPVQVKGASGKLEVTTVPPGFVDYQAAGTTPDGASVVMLTMKKAGDAVVRIKDGSGNTGKADLHVTAATDAEWNVGNDRYNNSILPINVPEGGFPMPDGGFMLPEAASTWTPASPWAASAMRATCATTTLPVPAATCPRAPEACSACCPTAA
jgi:hypothetical protein